MIHSRRYTNDPVNKPPHYGNGEIECIDYMRDETIKIKPLGFLLGASFISYVSLVCNLMQR